MSTFLSENEIKEMTRRIQRRSQRAVLNALGISHKVRPDGSIAILRAVAEKEFGLCNSKKQEKNFEPNWNR